MTPKIIHFVYGLDKNFSNKPFSFVHYLAIQSALITNPDFKVWIHVYYQPEKNVWWEKIKEIVRIVKIDNLPAGIHGKSVTYPEHLCDLIRLQILHEHGGIYLDIDTLCIKSFSPLMGFSFVMGQEKIGGMVNGLCNAVIISERESKFLELYLESFVDFRPDVWNYMAVQKPYEISKHHPDLIQIEPPSAFFKYDWYELIDLFNGDSYDIAGSYSLHLWESKLYFPLLRHVTPEDVKTRDCLFNGIARRYCEI